MTKRQNIVVVACIFTLIIAIVVFLLTYYGNTNKEFIYNENLNRNAVTIKGEEANVLVDLQEISYYIIDVEGKFNDMACQFKPAAPNSYWFVQMDRGYSVRDYAKDLAMDTCIRDNIYYLEALNLGMTLTETEKQLASDDVHTILQNLTAAQMDLSEFTYDELYNIEQKLYIVRKYAETLVAQGYDKNSLELDGDYYKSLKEKYNIQVNDEVWDQVELGHLTVNLENGEG